MFFFVISAGHIKKWNYLSYNKVAAGLFIEKSNPINILFAIFTEFILFIMPYNYTPKNMYCYK
jgi:hypothetical protein